MSNAPAPTTKPPFFHRLTVIIPMIAVISATLGWGIPQLIKLFEPKTDIDANIIAYSMLPKPGLILKDADGKDVELSMMKKQYSITILNQGIVKATNVDVWLTADEVVYSLDHLGKGTTFKTTRLNPNGPIPLGEIGPRSSYTFYAWGDTPLTENEDIVVNYNGTAATIRVKKRPTFFWSVFIIVVTSLMGAGVTMATLFAIQQLRKIFKVQTTIKEKLDKSEQEKRRKELAGLPAEELQMLFGKYTAKDGVIIGSKNTMIETIMGKEFPTMYRTLRKNQLQAMSVIELYELFQRMFPAASPPARTERTIELILQAEYPGQSD